MLFDSITLSTPSNIRNYAMLHLAFFLGLRPKEISLITLDSISFGKGEIDIKDRKFEDPITLPLPENTLKAIAAYLIGVRPKSEHRALFLDINPPHKPVTPHTVINHIKKCMQKAGLNSTSYWLRHTYAQNLLESGESIFKIKEMMGHKNIQSTKRYLHVHIRQMREVLFDETV